MRSLFTLPSRILGVAMAIFGASFLASPVQAQDVGNYQVFRTGFAQPAYLGSPPGEPERILVGELGGLIRVIENGVLLPTPFLDLRTRVRSGHGLIGVAFPPDYATTRRFYVNYTPAQASNVRVARYTTSANPNVANTVEETLFHTGNGSGDHNSGWMDFGIDGYLYIMRGDAGGSPQDPNQYQGKILRVDVSPAVGYTVPPDNPFVGITGLDEIAALGIRNAWRCGFDPLTGDLYVADVGAGSQEEVTFIPAGTIAGRNLGWPCVEGTICHGSCPCTPVMTPPIHTYGRQDGITVIGGTVYRGDAIPRWRGRYFFADFGPDRVWSFRVVDGVKRDLQEHTVDLEESIPAGQRPNSLIAFGVDGVGELYLLDLGGQIFKIVPEFAPADWTLDGVVNSADLFAFLDDFFALDADMTGDHRTTSLDFFEYLVFFFAP